MNKPIQAIYPLTAVQEGMLFHTIESPDSDIYFVQFACVMENLSDPVRWQNSWQALTQKHDILRTLFTWENRAQPLQVVKDKVKLPWTSLDWQDKDKSRQQSQWQHLMTRDRDLSFDLSQAPLMRFTLVKLKDNTYQFLFTFHHIILDGWSQLLLLEEALSIYNDKTMDVATITLKPGEPSYADYINYLVHRDNEAASEFWKDTLKGFVQVTNVSNEQARDLDDNQDKARHKQTLSLTSDVKSALLKQAKQHKLTLNSLILGAWSLILASHNHTDDVLFGTTVAGRPIDLPQSNKIVGLFINTIPFRAQVEAGQTLHVWLSKLQSHQAACREYEHMPLSDIQRLSDMPSGDSLFENILVVENLEMQNSEHAEGDLRTTQHQYSEYSHYPLALLIEPTDGLNLVAIHQESKISSKRAQEILAQLQSVLIQMSKSLEQVVSRIETLPQAHKPLLQQQWLNNHHVYNDKQSVHEIFELVASKHPRKNAVIDCSGASEIAFTYQQLNDAANKLAQFLISKGCGKGKIVPILLDKSVNALVCYFAVMKTGAAYVVLDPAQPSIRLNAILESLEDEELLVVSDSTALGNSFSEHIPICAKQVVLLDSQHQEINACSNENVGIEVSPNDLAYVIFTSGSTGTPKGVMIEHQALINSNSARGTYYPQAPSHFLLLSSLTTDSSVAGIYWTLLSSGCLVLPKNRIEQDMQMLGQAIREYEVSHLLCIPSLYNLMLENLSSEQLHSLEVVVVAGEKCPLSLLSAHESLLANTKLYNEYGPSECCVWSSVACLSDKLSAQHVSIGKAIANTQLYVLDKHHNLVLENVVGELYVAGNNLAKGYLYQDKKTQASFLANPYYQAELNNSTMYKTGDLVKLDANGELAFIGRADNQIKIRGFRVEPEEIEQVLMNSEYIEEALVCIQSKSISDGALLDALVALEPGKADEILSSIEQNDGHTVIEEDLS